MWHASVAHHGQHPQAVGTEHVRKAIRALNGVGSMTRGQWVEIGERAAHVRRCLSVHEQEVTGLTPRDIRGTPEVTARLAALRRALPAELRGMPDEALT